MTSTRTTLAALALLAATSGAQANNLLDSLKSQASN